MKFSMTYKAAYLCFCITTFLGTDEIFIYEVFVPCLLLVYIKFLDHQNLRGGRCWFKRKKKNIFLHSTGAVPGLWMLHMPLGCSQRWLELAWTQCRAATQVSCTGGRQCKEPWHLGRIPAALCFHLVLLPESQGLLLVCVVPLHEMEGYICLGACWWAVWKEEVRFVWNQPSSQLAPTAHGISSSCLSVHTHLGHGAWCSCLGPSTTAA